VAGSREDVVLRFGRDRKLAHQVLFRHRHPDATPPFHHELTDAWHSTIPNFLAMAFRGGAKSTLAEEAIVLGAAMGLIRNVLILGSNSDRANDRLRSIKHEIETNELLIQLYGELVGTTWNEAKVVLANGVVLQAFGRGQSLRGVKHLDSRPDFCFADDIEEEEHVRTPEARQETLSWFMSVVLPALDKGARVRVNATPLDRDALPLTLARQPGWQTRIYPIEHVDKHGDRVATWPARFPLTWVDEKRQEYHALGMAHEYEREYMCRAEDPARKVFTSAMFKIEPRVRSWQPTFAFYDPARTVKTTSATTGWACWSWIGSKLIVWDGGAESWRPDEMIAHMFRLDEEFAPVAIGVEETGLNEFLMQPLRQEQLKRAYLIPVEAWNAPRGKLEFIRGLQPFFNAGEVVLAKDIPAKAQFLSYPTGKIDFPNALAYALKMRPGQVIYDEFSGANVGDELLIRSRVPLHLALNAGDGVTTGVLLQYVDGCLHVLADWVKEGDPGAVIANMVSEAALLAPTPLRLVAGAGHFGNFDRVGLRGAVAKIPAELHRGGAETLGRDELRALLRRSVRGNAALQVASTARWTLNAFSSGYCRAVDKQGRVSEEARSGPYRMLMRGVEAFTAMLKGGISDDADDRPHYRYTDTGQRYVSALPGGASAHATKSDWLGAGTSVRERVVR
jgi:hypothetical protein